VLHLLAIASAAGVNLALDDFTRVGKRVPVLADLKPSGKYLMSELVAVGGIQPMMKTLLEAGLLHGGCLTVTGKTMAQNLASVQPYPAFQKSFVLSPIHQEGQPPRHPPRQPCPEGAVAKITGKEGVRFAAAPAFTIPRSRR